MKYEKIKSAILTVLVLVSIFLTWNLWTYQPNYATMEKNNYVAVVSLSEKKEVKKIIRPDKVFFHQKGEHYGTTNAVELEKLIKEISRWSFSDVKNITDKAGNINNLIHSNDSAEIVYPTDVPVDLYRNVLNFEEKNLPSFNFDRIVINVENADKENGIVYFISTINQQVYSSSISSTFINDFNRAFYKNAFQYPHYVAFNATESRTIFLAEDKTDMMEYKYFPVTLNSEEFKDALFNDPSFVQKSFVYQGEEYTNNSSKMNINYSKNLLLYVNPTAESNYVENSSELIKRSIDFVNEHGGWTDSYRYVEKDEKNHRVTFRLYSMEGYPVFNEGGVTEINETWGRNEISKYIRPNISLELPLKTEMQKVALPSGNDVIHFLQNKKNFKPELLEDVVLGYHFEKDSKESRLILLKPMWFYRYNKIWNKITMEDLGGMNNGLE